MSKATDSNYSQLKLFTNHVSHYLKQIYLQIAYNDILKFNFQSNVQSMNSHLD